MNKRVLLAALLAALPAMAAFPASAEGVAYRIDPNHTMVLASWSHFGYSNPSANFGGASGTIVYDASAPEKSTVEVVLPMSGLDTFVPKLDEHLKSPDFFDAEKYPQATFRSTGVKALGDGRLEVTGILDLHGVQAPVVLTGSGDELDDAVSALEKAGVMVKTRRGRAGRVSAAWGAIDQ